MGSDIIDKDQGQRAPNGTALPRLIRQWRSGLTEHGDVVLALSASLGSDPALSRSQFICTREDARDIAEAILRALAFSEMPETSFDAFRARIRAPALRALADDWNKARGQRQMPGWKEINPGLNAPYLACMWGFDRDPASGEFTGRVAGGNVMRTFGRNFLGTPLRDLYPPDVFEQARAGLVRVLFQPGCCRLSGQLFRAGDTVVVGERLLLPIGEDPTQPDGVLGGSWHDNELPAPAMDGIELLYDRVEWCQL